MYVASRFLHVVSGQAQIADDHTKNLGRIHPIASVIEYFAAWHQNGFQLIQTVIEVGLRMQPSLVFEWRFFPRSIDPTLDMMTCQQNKVGLGQTTGQIMSEGGVGSN